MLIFLIVFLFFFLLCSSFLSASETALFSLSSMKLKVYKQSSNRRKRLIAKLLSKPRDLLVTILMLNVLMNILIQNVVSGLFGKLSGWVLTVGVPLALTLVLGEVIPKSLALSLREKISYTAAPALSGLKRFFWPVRFILSHLADFISRFSFFYLKKEADISLEELRHALQTSRDFGILGREEAKLVRGYINLEEVIVKELMRPREEILYFDQDEAISKLHYLFVEQECTRLPICDGGIENLKGILRSGIFFLNQKNVESTDDLISLLDKPFFVPESTPAKALLRQMQEKKETLSIVVDEYGSISGLITLEDLFEVVIGQIADRRDEKPTYTRASNDVIIASGKLELAEFEEIFDVHLESPANMVTLGGWITEKIGDIPKTGARLQTNHFLFHVLSADPNRVRRVYIRRVHGKKANKKNRDIG